MHISRIWLITPFIAVVDPASVTPLINSAPIAGPSGTSNVDAPGEIQIIPLDLSNAKKKWYKAGHSRVAVAATAGDSQQAAQPAPDILPEGPSSTQIQGPFVEADPATTSFAANPSLVMTILPIHATGAVGSSSASIGPADIDPENDVFVNTLLNLLAPHNAASISNADELPTSPGRTASEIFPPGQQDPESAQALQLPSLTTPGFASEVTDDFETDPLNNAPGSSAFLPWDAEEGHSLDALDWDLEPFSGLALPENPKTPIRPRVPLLPLTPFDEELSAGPSATLFSDYIVWPAEALDGEERTLKRKRSSDDDHSPSKAMKKRDPLSRSTSVNQLLPLRSSKCRHFS